METRLDRDTNALPRTMQGSCIPRPHVVTRVRAFTCAKMAFERLYINGEGGGGGGGARERERRYPARKRKIRCKYLGIVYSRRAERDMSDPISPRTT